MSGESIDCLDTLAYRVNALPKIIAPAFAAHCNGRDRPKPRAENVNSARMAPDLIAVIFQMIWSGTTVLALFFVLLGIRVREDRSFLLFGLSLLVLNSLTTMDALGYHRPESLRFERHWFFVRHMLAFIGGPCILLFTMMITAASSARHLWIACGLAAASSIPFASDYLLGTQMVFLDSGRSGAGPLYGLVLLPYLLFVLYQVGVRLYRGSFGEIGAKSQISRLAMFGWALVGVGGLSEYAIIVMEGKTFPSGYLLITGVAAFGGILAYGFVERLLSMQHRFEQAVSKLNKANQEIIEVSGLAEIGKSAAIVSHEIRNRLAVIKGNSNLLKSRGGYDREELQRIVRSMDVLDSIVSSLTTYARSTAPVGRRHLNLGRLLEGIVEEHAFLGAIRFDCSGGLGGDPVVLGSEDGLYQAMSNVLKNSFEAGAEIVQVRLKQGLGRALLVIEDDGRGCNPEAMEKVFSPFYSTKGQMGGTGLGLSVVKAIIESHGGSISAYCPYGKAGSNPGFVLNIVLPAHVSGDGGMISPAPPIYYHGGGEKPKALQTVLRNLGLEKMVKERIPSRTQPGQILIVDRSDKGPASRFPSDRRQQVISIGSDGLCNLCDHDGNWGRLEVFTEEFLLDCLKLFAG